MYYLYRLFVCLFSSSLLSLFSYSSVQKKAIYNKLIEKRTCRVSELVKKGGGGMAGLRYERSE